MNKRQGFSLIICAALPVFGLAALLTFLTGTPPAGAAQALSLTVTNTNDDGPGSLRQAIADAAPGDSVDFALSYPAAITLTSGELLITRPLTIAGPGPELLAISGNHTSRVFRVDNPAGAARITVTLSGLTIRDGAAGDGGGLWNDENLTLADVILSGNSAGGWGGGMYNYNSNPTLTNVTFSGNSAFSGGGMYNESSSPTLTNVTFSGNLAVYHGGGLYNLWYSSPTIQNSILWGNRAAQGGNQIRSFYNSTPAIAHSDVEGSGGSGPGWDPGLGSDLGDNLDADPLFLGAVDPAVAPSPDGNLRLRWGSPAIDAGDNGLVPPGVTADLDGVPRFAYGTVDMGAYEFQPGLYLYKDAGVAEAAPGQRFAYTLQAINTFTATAMTRGQVLDALPAGLVFAGPISLDPPGAGLVGAAPPVLVSNLTLNPGQVVTVTLPVDVGSGVAPGTLITNTAAVHSQQVVEHQLASHTLRVCAALPTATSTADSGPGSLRQAIAHACQGASIDFALSYPATITLTSGELLITKPLTIAGPGPDLLAISGNHASQVFHVDKLFGAAQIAVTLSGLKIRDGYAYTYSSAGGGLQNDENLTLTDVTFRGNHAYYFGGGMSSVDGSLTLTGVTFNGNSTNGWGGGMINARGSLTLADVTFSGNGATLFGGGMASYESSPTLTNVTFSGNAAYSWGGGMYSPSGATLTNVTFSGNSASWFGGGMYSGGAPILTDVTFSGNSAGEDGGGMYNRDSSPMLTNVTFNGNSSGWSGGGMYNRDSSPTLIGVTFSGNVAGIEGGGLYLYASDATLVNNVVAGNQAGTSGSGLYVAWSSSARLLHTTLAGNHDGDGTGVSVADYGPRSTIALTNTILVSHTLGISVATGCTATLESTLWSGNGSDWAGTGAIGHVHDYSGQPAFADAATGDYHLRPGSAALDQGVETGLISDFDHQPRPYLAPDLGADEYWPPGALRHSYLPLILRSSP